MQKQTLDAKEAAALIGVSYWKILEMAKAKEIPHFRAGKRVLFRQDTLNSWMEKKELESVEVVETNQLRLIRSNS